MCKKKREELEVLKRLVSPLMKKLLVYVCVCEKEGGLGYFPPLSLVIMIIITFWQDRLHKIMELVI